MNQNESKHTPGPWIVPHFARPEHKCDCGYVFSEAQQGMGAIATVHYNDGKPAEENMDHEPMEIAIANAYLIAAAPDLLRELSHLVKLMEPIEKEGGFDIPGLATLNGARAAIAKAEKGAR